jgi:4,5-dihydroxyphthalate decarboxylase
VVPTLNRKLVLACNDYDRTRALRDGRISPEGVDLTFLPLMVEETFFRMMRHQEFDVSELSLSSYVVSLDDSPPPFTAIPVFPSRSFRHSGIYINADRGIEVPAQLAGGRVGVAEYQLTANVWIRGILSEHYDLPVTSVTYVTGGLEDPGRIEKKPLDLPQSISIERAPAGKTLSRMLDEGEIDAIYSPRAPSTYRTGRVARLFSDCAAVEQAWFRESGLFPIMHTVAIRRELYDEARWLAQSLYKAFEASLALTWEALRDSSALRYSLPWMITQAEEMWDVLGPNPWVYGLEPNRANLSTFLRYSYEQGLASRLRTPDDLFAPESLERFAL